MKHLRSDMEPFNTYTLDFKSLEQIVGDPAAITQRVDEMQFDDTSQRRDETLRQLREHMASADDAPA